MTTDRYGFEIDVPVRNEWSNVTLLVTSVQNCFHAMSANLDGSQTVAMVTGELLENAIKYGRWPSSEHRLRLMVRAGDGVARISVENPADAASVGDLMQTLAWIKSYPSAGDAFRARLVAIATSSDSTEESKLGLVRVAYEGRCAITAEANADVVRVTAELTL